MISLTPNARRVLEARYLRRDAGRRVIGSLEALFRPRGAGRGAGGARRLGLKRITADRDRSKGEAVLSLGAEEDPLARELFTECDPGACRP